MAETQLQGTVLRITFRNEENGYTIAKIRCEDLAKGEVAVVGKFSSIDVGEVGLFRGEWKHDKEYGRQLLISSYEFIIPTTAEGIERLLSKGKFRGIGPVYAKKIVKKFGTRTIDIIENRPIRLTEIQGISRKKVDEIKKSWARKKTLKNITLFLAEYEIPLHFAEKIFSRYRDDSVHILRNKPYDLANDIRGIGFKSADQMALSIGIKHDSNERIQGALEYLLREASDDGHTYLPREELVQKSAEYLDVDESRVDDNVELLKASNRVIIDDSRMYLAYLYNFEQQVVRRMIDIQKYNDGNELRDIDKVIAQIEKKTGLTYSERQRDALNEAMKQKILVLTGGPGTGKTTIIRAILALFTAQKLSVKLAAPTGRAAKRMEETCGQPAQTLHRLLDYNPADNNFDRNRTSPVESDVVIIDETSMVDTPLMAALLTGLSDTVRLILVGDFDQLPSVGPGNVFRDIIDSGRIPVVRLDTVFRQAESSDIVRTAHAVNSGEKVYIDNKQNTNLFFMFEDDKEKAVDTITNLVVNRLPNKYSFDPLRDIQVLTPMYKGETGALNLNSALQSTLNRSKKSVKRGDRQYRIGDKVMQVRNNYNKDVYNGDIGIIRNIDFNSDEIDITVQFEGRNVLYERKELDELVHAYAVTVHKSQGSEYQCVVMPLSTSHYIMLQRNLLYTAITRAKELMVIVGTTKALNIAVNNDKTAHRFTFLAERLRNPSKYDSQLNFLDSE